VLFLSTGPLGLAAHYQRSSGGNHLSSNDKADDGGNRLSSNDIKGVGRNVVATRSTGEAHIVSNRYGWSAHNCQHSGEKTGLVLYPKDTQYKNTVLLVCEKHFGYQSGHGTQHKQLEVWYYKIYGKSKDYCLVSGFSERANGALGYNSWSMNAYGPYSNNHNAMGAFEQNVVQKVVNGRINSYKAV
jgi:hypothetical protein